METRTVQAQDGTELHVAGCGDGPDVVVLSGGPGCVHYLAAERLAPAGFRCWFPDPRGVAASGGGPHTMADAIHDLEDIRQALGVERWIVLGHSWGSDLGVRYAIEHPSSVAGLVGMCGHGLHRDREWSAAYQQGKLTEIPIHIDHEPTVHESLMDSFKEWIHTPTLWRSVADCQVPTSFVSAGDDIRPSWPVEQLAWLAPRARHSTVPGAIHDFWSTEPDRWREVITAECRWVVNPGTPPANHGTSV